MRACRLHESDAQFIILYSAAGKMAVRKRADTRFMYANVCMILYHTFCELFTMHEQLINNKKKIAERREIARERGWNEK